MSKTLLVFFILGCLIAIVTPAVYDYACYEQGCSKIEGRCSEDKDCCEGYKCHPQNSSWQVVQKNGCYPENPIPCSKRTDLN